MLGIQRAATPPAQRHAPFVAQIQRTAGIGPNQITLNHVAAIGVDLGLAAEERDIPRGRDGALAEGSAACAHSTY